jgi:WD40 repeat protein
MVAVGYESSAVRLVVSRHPDRPTAGLGVLIGAEHVVTCAHVVNTALGRNPREQVRPGELELVELEFPLLPGRPMRRAHVAAWVPPPWDGLGGGDIAGLVLHEKAPDAVAPARFASSLPAPGATLRVYGYPDDPPRPAGAWVDLTLKGSIAWQLVQVESRFDQTIKAQPGYSGSPVWQDELGEVVGLLHATAYADQPDRDAYLLPGAGVAAAWEEQFGYLRVPPCPYQGLLPFTAENASVFFGRDEDIVKLADRVRGEPVTVVIGRSGVGKSSLVRAGLVSHMQDHGRWSVVLVNLRDKDPWGQLARELLKARDLADEVSSGSPASLDEEVAAEMQRLRAIGFASTARFLPSVGRPLLIIVDQFDELLATGSPIDSDLIELLLPPAGSEETACRIVITLRSDLVDDIPDAKSRLNDRLYYLGPLDALQLRQAIVGPAAAVGVTFDPEGLVDQIARDTPAGALPLLQFTLTRLWETQRHRTLTFAGYHAIGGVTGALDQFVDQVQELTYLSDDVVNRALLRLVRGATDPTDRVRGQRVYRQTVPDEEWAALSHLATARLVIADTDPTAGPYAELAHEALLQSWGRLRRIVSENAEFLAWLTGIQRRATDQDPIPEDQIAQARRWLEAKPQEIPPAVRTFVENSQTVAEARLRGTRRRLRLLLALVLALAVVTGFAYGSRQIANHQRDVAKHQRDVANQQRDLAISQQLINQSEALGEADPAAAKLKSLAAWEIDPSDQARFAMMAAAALPGIATFTGFTSNVYSVTFSPDGKTLATGASDVRLWDIASRRQIGGPFAARSASTFSSPALAFSPDGKTLATGGADVRLWAVATRRQIGSPFGTLSLGNNYVHLGFSPDGKNLLSGSSDGAAQVWDVASRHQLATPLIGNSSSSLVQFSPDGKTVIGGYGPLGVWDVASGREISRMPVDDTAAFSLDGKRLVSGGYDNVVRLWDVASGHQIGAALTGHTNWVTSVAFSPDGKLVASGSADGTVRVWDVASQREIGAPLTGHTGVVVSVAFSPDGKVLASGGSDESVRLWDVANLPQIGSPLTGHIGDVQDLSFSPDGKLLASSGTDNRFQLWDVANRRPIGAPLADNAQELPVAFSPDGKTLAVGGRDVRLWDVASQHQIGGPFAAVPMGSPVGITSLAFSPDGKTLATNGNPVRLWDVTTHRQIGAPFTVPLLDDGDGIASLAFSPDGKTLATGTEDRSIRLWDVASRHEIGTPLLTSLIPAKNGIYSLTFSPNGKTLASGSFDGTVHLWDVASRRQLDALTANSRGFFTIAFSPDSKTLAGGSVDGTVRLWDLASHRQIGGSLMGHTGIVESVAFSPDGKALASGGTDGTVRLWNVAYTTDVVAYLCRSIGGSFTRGEWQSYVPAGPPYRDVCR